MTTFKQLFSQSRALTRKHYHYYLMSMLWIILLFLGTTFLQMQLGKIFTSYQQDMKSFIQKSISIDGKTQMDTLQPADQVKLDNEITQASASFLRSSDNYKTYITIVSIMIASILISFVIQLGITHTSYILSATEQVSYTWTSFFKQMHRIGGFLFLMILQSIAVLLGTMVFILPGIFIAIRLSLSSYSFVAENHGARASMKHSRSITGGNFWRLLGYYILIGIIQVIGAFALFIGMAWTIPLGQTLLGRIYRSLDTGV